MIDGEQHGGTGGGATIRSARASDDLRSADKLLTCMSLLLALGCSPSGPAEKHTGEGDPATPFRRLEERLLAAGTIHLDFHVIAEGAVAAELRGELDITPAGAIRLAAAGHFNDRPAALSLESRDGQYTFGNGPRLTTAPAPPHLREALLVGFTRMGILHNLARLTSGAPPDHAEGGVKEWVSASSFAVDTTASTAVAFELNVAGEPAGSASLVVDARGLPLVRRQTVRFPGGEMRVRERYSRVRIEP
jgi:hypothetical protein